MHAHSQVGGSREEADLFPGAKIVGVVPYGHLQRPVSEADQLCDDFPIEVEPIRDEIDALDAFGTEHLVHRERVAETGSVRDVEERQEHPVSRVHYGRLARVRSP